MGESERNVWALMDGGEGGTRSVRRRGRKLEGRLGLGLGFRERNSVQ